MSELSDNSTDETVLDIKDKTKHMDLIIVGIISLMLSVILASTISYAFYKSIIKVRLRRHVIRPELVNVSRWLSEHCTCSFHHNCQTSRGLQPTAPAVSSVLPDEILMNAQTYSTLPPPYHCIYFDIIAPERTASSAPSQTNS